jgi:hypothetical protein
MTAFCAAITGVLIGLFIRLRIDAWRLNRANERVHYAAQELTRRKVGALQADLRDKRGEL